jgi:hypothetical protein
MPVRRARRIAAWLVGALALVLVLAQIFLPKLAASRISSRLGHYGKVDSVSVSAWPAVKLLWGHADSVTVRASNISLSPARTAKLLWEARGLNDVDLTVAALAEGRAQLSDVHVRKRGNALTARARASAAEVRSSLPAGLELQLLSSTGGQLVVRAGGGLFGTTARVEAVVSASGGRLILSPLHFLLGGIRLSVFAEPHVYVEGVGASASRDPSGEPSYLLRIWATLR